MNKTPKSKPAMDIRPLRKSDIQSEWNEGEEDGYWIALKPGLKWAGDTLGAVHSIHESTKRKAHDQDVMTCRCSSCHIELTDIISRMEAMQQRFGQLQLEDLKSSYWDRIMSDPNRRDRYDDALLEAHMEAQRAFDGEDAEVWQERSERQGAE